MLSELEGIRLRAQWFDFTQVIADYTHPAWFDNLAHADLCRRLQRCSLARSSLSQYLTNALGLSHPPAEVELEVVRLSLALKDDATACLQRWCLSLIAFALGRELSGEVKQGFATALGPKRFAVVQAHVADPMLAVFYRWIPYRSLQSVSLQGLEDYLLELAARLWRLVMSLLPQGLRERVLLTQPFDPAAGPGAQEWLHWSEIDDPLKPKLIRWLVASLDTPEVADYE